MESRVGCPFKIMKGIWEEKKVDSTAMIDVPIAFSNMTTIEGGTRINSDGKDRREKWIGFWGAFLTTLFCREPTTERSGKQHTPHYQGFPCHEEIEHTGAVHNTINPSSTTSQQETATKLFMRTLYNWTGIIVKSAWYHLIWIWRMCQVDLTMIPVQL